ncbi:MAG: hypothetical protein Q9160_006190 [Pyrenula sp. 1 TL-2023]
MDEEDSKGDEDKKANLRSRRVDDSQKIPQRKRLFHDLLEDLRIYDELLEHSTRVFELPEPTTNNRVSVAHMIWNDGHLCQEDRDYIRYREDLMALAGEGQRGLVSGFFEGMMKGIGRPIGDRLFKTENQTKKTHDRFIFLYSNQRIEKAIAIFLILIIVGLLMIPIFVLSEMSNKSSTIKNVVVFIFTSMFAAVCSLSTLAKRHEIFAGTATYCAVLVVFVGHGPPGDSSCGACSSSNQTASLNG